MVCHERSREQTWAAWYITWLLIKLTPRGVVFSFLFSCEQAAMLCPEGSTCLQPISALPLLLIQQKACSLE